MKIINRISKILFTFILFCSFVNVYGYNLKYLAKYTSLSGGTGECYVTTIAKAYEGTIDDYNNRTGGDGSWINYSSSDGFWDTSGSDVTFRAFYYAFYPYNSIRTVYDAGFDTSGSNTTNNNIYYDTYSGVIDESFNDIGLLYGNAANVSENQSRKFK